MSFKFRLSGDLLHARNSRGWTQPMVADAVSISLRQYQYIENGRHLPSSDTFLKLVFLFELDIYAYRDELPICPPSRPVPL